MSDHAIDAQGLTRRFGSFTAVDAITFHVEPGEVFGFLGANGAGKTTAIRMLIGALAAHVGLRHGGRLRSQDPGRAGAPPDRVHEPEVLPVRGPHRAGEHHPLRRHLRGERQRHRHPHRRHPHPDRAGARGRRAGAGDPARLEAAARLLRRAAAPAGRGLPRRADRRRGSHHPAAVLGADLRGGSRRHQRPRHHALSGRGGVLPPDLHHGERRDRGDGNAGRGPAGRWERRRWTRCSSSSPGRAGAAA